MQYGEAVQNITYISKEDVGSALKAMASPSVASAQFDSLHTLILIDQFLANPDLPAIRHSREFALYEIITQIITDSLSTQRTYLGLPTVRVFDNVDEYRRSISLDGQQDSTELMCWSLLYHCFARIELNIDVDEYSELVGFSPRTMRRYRALAIDYLTNTLIRAEWTARIQYRRQRLLAQLPTISESVRLFGRDPDMKIARLALTSNPTATILVTGPTGIGKTAFTQELLRSHIEESEDLQLSHLVWISNPSSINQIYDELHAAVPITNHTITLREWMTVYQLAVVIDGAQDISGSTQDFHQLLDFLDPALVCITSHIHTPLSKADVHVVLTELNETAASQLIAETYHTRYAKHINVTVEDIDTVRAIAGGNPLAILLTIHNMFIGDSQVDANVLDRLLQHMYLQLTVSEKRTWIAFALFPPTEIAEFDILALWPHHLTPAYISTLIHRHILEVVNSHTRTYRLSNVARNYVASLYARSSECLTLVNELVDSIQDHAAEHLHIALVAMSHISGLGWLNVDKMLKRRWLSQFARVKLDLSNQPQWLTLVQNSLPDGISSLNYEAQINHGVILRQLSHWPEAEDVFRHIIVASGKTGNFQLQAQARAELGVTLRYRGRYEESIVNLEQADLIARRYQLDELMSLLALERTQLAIDRQDRAQALHLLANIPRSERNLRHRILASEAHLLNGNLDACREEVSQLTMLNMEDRLTIGRLHDLMGRVHLASGDFDKAHYRFSIAVSCFSVAEEPFALARGLSNLGAVLLRQGLQDEAYDALRQALHIQARLGDTVGMLATQKNLDICLAYSDSTEPVPRPNASSSTTDDDTSTHPPASTTQ